MPHYKFDQLAYNITDKKIPEPGDEKMYIGLEHLDSGNLKVTRWGNDVELKGQKLLMKQGDILFGRRNTYLRRAAIAPHDGIFSAHGMVFRPKTEVIDPEYFPFFISSNYFMDAAIRISVGSLSPTVNWKTLKELEFDIPTLKEQKQNAKLLKSINETKEAYQELLNQTDNLVKSQFVEMFGDTVSEKQVFDTVALEKIFNKPQAGVWGEDDPNGDGVPVLRTANFTNTGVIDYSDVATRILDENKITKKYICNGDILIEKSGGSSDRPVGRVVFYEGKNGMFLNNNFTACLHLNNNYQINRIYAFYFMFVNYWFGGTELYEGKTTGIHNSRLSDYLKGTYIPLAPIELQEQFEILARQSNKLKYELEQAITSVDNMMKAILYSNLEDGKD